MVCRGFGAGESRGSLRNQEKAVIQEHRGGVCACKCKGWSPVGGLDEGREVGRVRPCGTHMQDVGKVGSSGCVPRWDLPSIWITPVW